MGIVVFCLRVYGSFLSFADLLTLITNLLPLLLLIIVFLLHFLSVVLGDVWAPHLYIFGRRMDGLVDLSNSHSRLKVAEVNARHRLTFYLSIAYFFGAKDHRIYIASNLLESYTTTYASPFKDRGPGNTSSFNIVWSWWLVTLEQTCAKMSIESSQESVLKRIVQ